MSLKILTLKINHIIIIAPEGTKCTNGDIRLNNGSSTLQGNLDICMLGKWRVVCSNIEKKEAKVVCSHLLGRKSKGIV